MPDDIDRLLTTPTFAGLAELETDVWTRVRERIERRREVRVRAAVLAVALAVGAVNGGWTALERRPADGELRVFNASASLPLLSAAERG